MMNELPTSDSTEGPRDDPRPSCTDRPPRCAQGRKGNSANHKEIDARRVTKASPTGADFVVFRQPTQRRQGTLRAPNFRGVSDLPQAWSYRWRRYLPETDARRPAATSNSFLDHRRAEREPPGSGRSNGPREVGFGLRVCFDGQARTAHTTEQEGRAGHPGCVSVPSPSRHAWPADS